MHQFAGVLLQVDARDADALRAALDRDLKEPAHAEGLVVLGYLIIFRQVRIVVVLAVPLREVGDRASERQGHPHGQFDGLFVHHRQDARHAEAHGADARVRRRVVLDLAPAEQFRAGRQVHVDLETDGWR